MKTQKPALNPVLVSVSRLVNVEDGWAGNDSIAPNLRAIKEAMTFARTLPDVFPQPHVNPAPDGEVNFYWKYDNVWVDLGFYGNGTYSYFARIGKTEWIGDNVPYSQALPPEIIERMF